jgi:hypothetical protein
MSETRTLHFYTTGEAYTNMMYDFFRSGEFKLFEDLLGDGNLNKEQKRMAFELRMKLEGDTRQGDLSCCFTERPADFGETLYYSIRTALHGLRNERFIELRELAEATSQNESTQKKLNSIKTILKYFTVEEINSICCEHALREEGYFFTDVPEESRSTNGVILKDGRFIECGYQDHINLYPILYRLDLADASDWTRSKETIHVTSGQISGAAAMDLEVRWRDGTHYLVTPEQVATLWRLRDCIKETYGSYSENTCMQNLIRKYVINTENLGGKWGNLAFIKKYFPEIPTPKTSRDYTEFPADSTIFVRTSPNRSLPGLLNSILCKANADSTEAAIRNIYRDYEKVESVLQGNRINWFYQEFLDGPNGVCHVRREPNAAEKDYTFSYQVADEQGAVVAGKSSSTKLAAPYEIELKALAVKLYEEIEEDGIQIEFVLHNDRIYLVQLRPLEREFEKGLGDMRPAKTIATGLTFSSTDSVEVNVNDILIVKEDSDSEQLLGKKALIVENQVEFSHILALAKALGIPAMYGTGPVDHILTENQVRLHVTTKTAYISKI